MKFRPLQDRVLIRRIEEEEKTKGGIIIPDTAKEKPMEGEIIAAGPGTRDDDGKLRPLQDRILVRRVQEEEKTKGGIIIPDTAKEKPIEGEVIAVGNGKILEDGSVRKLDVKVGDRILFGKYSGTEVKVDGEDRLILREDDILGIIEK